jgi:hypothetical protein
MAKETLIGKVLSNNETNYDRCINAYNSIIPVINDIAATWESYGFGPFTQEAYNDILKNHAKSLKERYNNHVRKSIEDLKIVSPTIRQNMFNQAAKDMDVITEKIDGLSGLFNKWTRVANGPFT